MHRFLLTGKQVMSLSLFCGCRIQAQRYEVACPQGPSACQWQIPVTGCLWILSSLLLPSTPKSYPPQSHD